MTVYSLVPGRGKGRAWYRLGKGAPSTDHKWWIQKCVKSKKKKVLGLDWNNLGKCGTVNKAKKGNSRAKPQRQETIPV